MKRFLTITLVVLATISIQIDAQHISTSATGYTGNIYHTGGFLGIGTTAPSVNFDLYALSNPEFRLLENDAAGMKRRLQIGVLGTPSTGSARIRFLATYSTTGNYPFSFEFGGSIGQALLINTDGKLKTFYNLGVKRDATTYPLEVEGTIALTQNIQQIGTVTEFDINPYQKLRLGRSTNNAAFAVEVYLGNNTATVNHSFRGIGNSFICNNNGNFGIGTSAPSSKLDVRGTSGSIELARFFNSDYTTGIGSGLKITGGAASGDTYMHLQAYDAGATSTNNLVLQNAGGNVGIGTTNPDSKLTVNGKIKAEEIEIITDVPASDYVFEKDYNLLTIDSVSRFVETNKHLPGVPTATEFKENGYKVGQMDDLLLRKIEELTLYIIQQQKRIEELERKVGNK